MDNSKNKIKQAAVFLLILFLLFYIPGRIMTPKLMTDLELSNWRNGTIPKVLSEPDNSIDLLVIGDSESYTSIDTRFLKNKYGIRAYDAGQAAATVSQSYEILENSLKRQRPVVVLYETNSLYRKQPDPKSASAVITDTLYDIFPLLKYHSSWKSPFIQKHEQVYRGFRIDKRVKPYLGGNYLGKDDIPYKNKKIGQLNVEYLRKMKALSESKGARFIMYSAPSPKNYDHRKHKNLTKLAKREKIPYIDMNLYDRDMKMDWKSDTRDQGDHLNVYGARKATRFLGEYLVNKFPLIANIKHSSRSRRT